MRYLVRTNCEYSIEVVADSSEEAMKKAEAVPMENWDSAWAAFEAEEEG